MPEGFMRGIEAVNGIVGADGAGSFRHRAADGAHRGFRGGSGGGTPPGPDRPEASPPIRLARNRPSASSRACAPRWRPPSAPATFGGGDSHPFRRAGAVFWMWVMALLGMMTSYAENVLASTTAAKTRRAAGAAGRCTTCGTALAASRGGCWRCCLLCSCALASFGIGNLSQLNSIAGNLKAAFGVPEAVTGAVLAAVSAVILLAG